MSTPRAHVGVTGATGFIGGHVIEALVAQGAPATAMARTPGSLTRLAVHPPYVVRLAVADVRDRHALAEQLGHCDAVVHAVYGNRGDDLERRAVTVDGTAAVIDACRRSGVRRLVHLGTVASYDPGDRRSFDETAPLVPPGGTSYGATKRESEDLVLDAADDLEVVVLQPTVVYGPWGGDWTRRVIERLPEDSERLPSGTTGICNPVYVGDVAAAVLHALTVESVEPQRLLVTGPEPETWGAFFDGFRSLVGLPAPENPRMDELPAWERMLYLDSGAVEGGRARSALGWTPAVDLASGMERVEGWARWMRLIGERGAP